MTKIYTFRVALVKANWSVLGVVWDMHANQKHMKTFLQLFHKTIVSSFPFSSVSLCSRWSPLRSVKSDLQKSSPLSPPWGSRGYFRSECWTGRKSTAATCVNDSTLRHAIAAADLGCSFDLLTSEMAYNNFIILYISFAYLTWKVPLVKSFSSFTQ